MKLSNLFIIALLAGTLGVFGCSDDPPANGNGGNGGNGGSGTAGTGGGTGGSGGADPCTGEFCDDSAQPNKAACEAFIDGCSSLGAGGAGGAPPTPEDCDRIGGALCQHEVGTGGTGGTGGGGGTGGTPSGGNCDYGLCVDDSAEKATCETLVGYCEATLDLFPELLDYCIEGTNLDQCGDP
jgi:hypothetical protein